MSQSSPPLRGGGIASRSDALNMETVTRRQMLQCSAVGFGALAATALLAQQASAGAEPGRPSAARIPARAKRIIFLFMSGGPSSVDTFDDKPLLRRHHGRPYPFARPRITFAQTENLFASPWRFRRYGQCGMPVSDLFPNLARCVDDLCFIHSVHGTNAAHGPALLKLHTGSDGAIRPSMGAWVNYGLGSENQDLPGFVTICPMMTLGGSSNWGNGFLPGACQGLPLGQADAPVAEARVGYVRNARFSESVQRIQLDRLAQINRDHQRSNAYEAALESRLQSFELAFRMQRAMPEAEDVSRETPATHRLYGLDDPLTHNFGRQCLLARRLSERGVRFVQVTHSDRSIVNWDQHEELEPRHAKNARAVDVPIAGLLTDLKARGLLDDTLVWWGGEFGRTPTAQRGGGRDHNPEGFTIWLAGGGVKPGFRFGATDDYGWHAVRDKVHIHDLHATILWLLGLDHERLTFRHGGRDFRLTDVYGNVVHDIIGS